MSFVYIWLFQLLTDLEFLVFAQHSWCTRRVNSFDFRILNYGWCILCRTRSPSRRRRQLPASLACSTPQVTSRYVNLIALVSLICSTIIFLV